MGAWIHEAALWEHEQRPSIAAPVVSSSSSSQAVAGKPGLPVQLHIYDVSQEESIQKINRILAHKSSPVKLGGVFHAGVEVHGLEWSYGFSACESRSGISCVEPRMHPQHHYRQTVSLKRTH